MFHLLDCETDFQTRSMAAAVAGDGAVTLGRRGKLRDVWAAARVLRERRGAVHAWGNRALIAAAIAGSRPIVYTPPMEMSAGAWKVAVWVARRRDATVICPTEAVRNALCRRGIAPDRCRLIRPGTDGAAGNDSGLRRELGLRENDFVVLAPGESTRAAEHNLGLWATAIAHELDPTWKLLVWGRGPLAGQVGRLGKRLNHPELLYFGRRWEYSQLTGAADAAIVTERNGPSLGVAICMAAGLPIVQADADRTASSLARKLIAVRADPARRAEMARQARAEAEELFGVERFLEMHRSLYEELGAGSGAVTRPGS
jgi:glycosyltransferase involved in cell wall biosynthesis